MGRGRACGTAGDHRDDPADDLRGHLEGVGTRDVRRAARHHLTRTPMTLDTEGWSEVVSLLNETLDQLFTVQTRSSERMAQNGEESMPVKVVMMQFKSPKPSGEEEKGD